MTTQVLRAHNWRNNSDLIANGVVPLGYIKPDDYVLDPTFGKGNWWNEYQPKRFRYHDLKLDGVRFERLHEHYDPGIFDVVAFDPPYIAPGGRASSTTTVFNGAYGINDCPRTPNELHAQIVAGMASIKLVLRPGGLMLLKCMNYVTSGKYLTAAYDLLEAATEHGWFKLVDEFIHVGSPGPQPKRDQQLHTRANYSNLFVLERQKNR